MALSFKIQIALTLIAKWQIHSKNARNAWADSTCKENQLFASPFQFLFVCLLTKIYNAHFVLKTTDSIKEAAS